jgi:excinuclease ABC subunit C
MLFARKMVVGRLEPGAWDGGDMQDRPETSSIPEGPGSYLFYDEAGRVLYVGKAKSLRARLSSYLGDTTRLAPRTAEMVGAAERVEWIQVASEVEALLLEHSLIREHRPRYNIALVDDESYPWLALSMQDEWPRAVVVRRRDLKGARYFGPFPHRGALRDTLGLALSTFGVRSCTKGVFERHKRIGRPCLLYDIKRCSGPCIDAVTHEEYDELLHDFAAVFTGGAEDVERRLKAEMEKAATELEFERAARRRDQLAAMRLIGERQSVVSAANDELDVVAVAEDELMAAVCVLRVRGGKLVGRRVLFVDKVEDLSGAALVGRVLEGLYESDEVPPRSVLVEVELAELALARELLTRQRGGEVSVRIPKRGAKAALMVTAAKNAAEELGRSKQRRATDHDSRSRALVALQQALGMKMAPLRIECYDMSHLQGTDYVGSMVVLEDGLSAKREYRKFTLKGVAGNDDFAAMEEVLTRRLTALLVSRERVDGEKRSTKFAYPPQLILLDGGKGQLSVGIRVLAKLGLSEEIALAALAKEFEEVFVPGQSEPVHIERGNEALYILQRARDEAHRFAIGTHRKKRGKRMTASVLDGIGGLGAKRKARLLKELGGVGAVKQATLEQLKELSWLPDDVAERVVAALSTSSECTTMVIWMMAAV